MRPNTNIVSKIARIIAALLLGLLKKDLKTLINFTDVFA